MNLDLALLLASIIFTVLLAFVGIEMANNPPVSSKAKRIYRTTFIVLGSLLIGTTYWQGKRNTEEQAKTKAAAAEEEAKLENRYNEVKEQYNKLDGRLTSIQNFSKHPPATFTPQQIGEAIRAMAGSGNLKQRTLDLARIIQTGMQEREKELLERQSSIPESVRKNQITIPQNLSVYFRLTYLPQVIEIRDELAGHGFKNKDLDDFIRYDQMEVAGRQDMLRMGAKISPVVSIPLSRIQEVVDDLNMLAGQMKD